MYVKINNGSVEKYPYTIRDLYKDNPNTSFPAEIPNERLADWDVFPVEFTTKPEADHTKNVVESTPINNNGWKQVWVVTDATAEEVAERTNNQAKEIRQKRTLLLAECDWTQLPDAPVDKTAWTIYRQALRDITNQPEFPWNVTWPTKP